MAVWFICRKAESGIDLWTGGEQRKIQQNAFRMSGKEEVYNPGDLTLFQCRLL